jgi:hypothetical protein
MNILSDKVKATGILKIDHYDEFGELKQQIVKKNLVTTLGFDIISARLFGTGKDPISHMAVGTDDTAAATTDTALGAEVGRVSASISQVTTNTTNDSVQVIAPFPAGVGTGLLAEAGILNAATGGDLFNRLVFTPIDKGALDSITLTWKVIFSS